MNGLHKIKLCIVLYTGTWQFDCLRVSHLRRQLHGGDGPHGQKTHGATPSQAFETDNFCDSRMSPVLHHGVWFSLSPSNTCNLYSKHCHYASEKYCI